MVKRKKIKKTKAVTDELKKSNWTKEEKKITLKRMLSVTKSKLMMRFLVIRHLVFQNEMSSKTVCPTTNTMLSINVKRDAKFFNICVRKRIVYLYLYYLCIR